MESDKTTKTPTLIEYWSPFFFRVQNHIIKNTRLRSKAQKEREKKREKEHGTYGILGFVTRTAITTTYMH